MGNCAFLMLFAERIQELRLRSEENVKARNALRPNNSPYEFSVTENGDEFTVVLEAKDTNGSVIFSLADRAIRVRELPGAERCSM